jgi:hypothetical protein
MLDKPKLILTKLTRSIQQKMISLQQGSEANKGIPNSTRLDFWSTTSSLRRN